MRPAVSPALPSSPPSRRPSGSRGAAVVGPSLAGALVLSAGPALAQDPTCSLSDGVRIWSATRVVADKGGLRSNLLYVPPSDTLFIHHTKGYARVSGVSTAGWAGAVGSSVWDYDLYHCGDCPHSVLTMTITPDATRGYVQGNCCSIGYWFFDESGQGLLSAGTVGGANPTVVYEATIGQTPSHDLAFLSVSPGATSYVLDVSAPVGGYAGLDTAVPPTVASHPGVQTWVVGTSHALGFGHDPGKLVTVALDAPATQVAELALPAYSSAAVAFTPQQDGPPVLVLQEGAGSPSAVGRLLLASADSAGQIVLAELAPAGARLLSRAQRSGEDNWSVALCGCVTPSCTEPIGDGLLYRFQLTCTGAVGARAARARRRLGGRSVGARVRRGGSALFSGALARAST
jgi:hypothetical protein